MAPAAAALLVAAVAILRLVIFRHRALPIGYGVPLVLFAWLRSKPWLWVCAAGFVVVSFIRAYIYLPPVLPEAATTAESTFRLVITLTDLLIITSLVHATIGVRLRLESRNAELSAIVNELASREEEIARQNEELQSQAEELERQAEELRVVNDDLATHGRTLESLLSLSRALTTDLDRHQTLDRICDTMGHLIDTAATASAILEIDGDQLVVRCHRGFDGGPREPDLQTSRSFASLVLARGRTGYVEDLRMRSDLEIPQPRQGPAFVAVLASPLRVAGRAVGTLEVYRSEPGPWPDEQVTLLESLAAQASVSLEAAHLFESVQHEQQRLQAVLRTVPIGIAVAGTDYSEVRVNPAGAAVFNVATDTNLTDPAVAATWQFIVDNKAIPRDQYPLARALREGVETHALEVELHLADGRQVILLMHAAPIRGPAGEISGAVSVFMNITPQKELQRELDLRRRDAEEASVRKTRFLAALSHDIRTPANAISLLAELIRRSAASPAMAGDVPDLAKELHSSAVSLVNLLSDVLDLARFDSGRIDMQETEFNLAALLTEEGRQMLPLARDKGLELHYIAPEPPLVLRADRIKLSRVLGNLVGNAIKFTERGEVRIEARRGADGAVILQITDSGIGIADQHLRHIFDEFFQLRNPERDRTKGTGLGLTICRRLVDAMGGRLEVQSVVGQGSVFTVMLPATCVVAVVDA
jgi:PAS domain S-box-containing protein